MKRSTLFLVLLLLTVVSTWAQPVPGNPVTTISNATITEGTTTVDIPVTVSSFTGVGNISLVLYYSGAEIHSPAVIYVNPDIAAWGNFEANMAIADSITISAYNPDVEDPITGVTLADGTTLFTLRFTIGTLDDFTEIHFYENSEGTSCEFGGIGPDYTEFLDTPQSAYYIPGMVELIDLDPGVVASAQFICEGDDVAALTSSSDASGEGNIACQWQLSTTSATDGFSNIEGAVAASYDPGTLSVDTWYRRMATTTLNGVEWTEYSNAVLVTVINFEPEEIVGTQTVCEGTDITGFNSNYAWGDGNITYQWQKSTVGESEGFIDIEGATFFYYDEGPVTTDTWYRREATATLGGTECIEYSNVIQVTVINFEPGSISGGEMLCEGEDPVAFASTGEASGDGVTGYQWQLSTTGESGEFSNIEGATTATYDPGTIISDSWFRRMATSTVNGSSCSESSNVVAVIVINSEPGQIGTDQYIAEGADAALITSEADATGDGTISYQWQMSIISDSEGFSDIAGATLASYDHGILNDDAWFRRESTVSYDLLTCTKYSNTIAVTVINFVPGSIADNQTVCEAEEISPILSLVFASGDGTISYQWQSSTVGESEGFSDIEGAVSASYEPAGLSVDTWFRRKATATLGGIELSEYSNVVSVNVINLNPGSIDNEQTICSGEDAAALTSVAEATADGTVTYQWQSGTTSASEGFADIQGAISASYDPGPLTSDTWFRRTAYVTESGTECAKFSNAVKVTVNQRRTISGTFYYYNAAGNIPMTGQDCIVKLYKTSDVAHETLLATTIPDASAHFEFNDICPDCEYDIVTICALPNTGAINTTDAAQINYFGAHPSTIEKVKFYAGDIGTSGIGQDLTINSTDAGRIQHYFVYGTPIDRKWTFWKSGTTISSNTATESYPSVYLPVDNNLIQDMYGLCTGDFNRSFNPVMTKAASSTLQLVYNGNKVIGSGQEFDLPVRMINPGTVGAISLILNFPSEMVEIKDVVMNAGGQLDWAVNGNELRIGWNSATPAYLQANAELLTLRLKTTPAFGAGVPVLFTLANDPLNELADEMFNVIGNAVLGIETVNGNMLGIEEIQEDDNLILANYPNPFYNETTVSYVLPGNGMVSIEINSLVGNRTLRAIEENQLAGAHEVKINTGSLPAGVYAITLKFKTANDLMVKTIKTIKNR